MIEETNEPKSFIVQNVTLGPHYVSDIRLNFAPLQAIDLTWEDAKVVKASKDLRNSLRMGLLKQISVEQFESIEERAAQKEKKELLRQQNNERLTKMDVDGRELEVETIDAERAYNPDKTVSTAGYANDSLSYAMALDIAQKQAELRGDELSVEQFADQVRRDPGVVNRMISMQRNMQANSSVSGDERRGRAYVATPSNDPTQGTQVQEMRMTSLNNNNRVDFNYDDIPDLNDIDDGPIAEAIDLEGLDDNGDEKGSFKRV